MKKQALLGALVVLVMGYGTTSEVSAGGKPDLAAPDGKFDWGKAIVYLSENPAPVTTCREHLSQPGLGEYSRVEWEAMLLEVAADSGLTDDTGRGVRTGAQACGIGIKSFATRAATEWDTVCNANRDMSEWDALDHAIKGLIDSCLDARMEKK
jgi:hypothetical protein